MVQDSRTPDLFEMLPTARQAAPVIIPGSGEREQSGAYSPWQNEQPSFAAWALAPTTDARMTSTEVVAPGSWDVATQTAQRVLLLTELQQKLLDLQMVQNSIEQVQAQMLAQSKMDQARGPSRAPTIQTPQQQDVPAATSR